VVPDYSDVEVLTFDEEVRVADEGVRITGEGMNHYYQVVKCDEMITTGCTRFASEKGD
jgi:hypothetical protein